MDSRDAARELRLLSDPTRARILSLILESPDGRELVGRMALDLELRQPTVSHHVKALVDDGILLRRPAGRVVWYSIAPQHLDRVSELLHDVDEVGLNSAVLERVSADLSSRFAGVYAPETVGRYVHESYELLAERARIKRYLPSLTARFAADRLSALARDGARTIGATPEVLFVCVQNAGRSQMAAAILRHLAGDGVVVRTAGSEPADAVRSVVVSALDEIGVPLGGEFPKPLTDEVVRAADVVITMGCGDACPVYPGRRYLDWDLQDPVGQPIARVREIRDDIDARVRELLPTLRAA
ncbi:MAG TPA: metalloregulator ArsR/SmtB family transcription factor [Pseudolysinimonas sp.]